MNGVVCFFKKISFINSIEKTLDPSVKVLARLPSDSHVAETLAQDEERIVAVQQNQILATAFHVCTDASWSYQ